MDIQLFGFNGESIRTVALSGEIWFVLADICRILEITNPSNVAARLDDDEKITLHLTEGGVGNVLVNESGLYSVLLRSDKPLAKPFKKWVTSEVLPSIRKTGGYQLIEQPKLPANYLEALKALVASEEDKLRLEVEKQVLFARIEADAPKVEGFDRLKDAKGTLCLSDMFKAMKLAPVIAIKQMRADEFLYKRGGNNLPIQRWVEQGLLVVREAEDARGYMQVQARVTGKGVDYFTRLYGGRADLSQDAKTRRLARKVLLDPRPMYALN